MKLLIDAGNTRTKWAWSPEAPLTVNTQFEVIAFDNQQWLQEENHSDVQDLYKALSQADEIWISNVAGPAWMQRLERLQPTAKLFLIKASTSALGLNNCYIDPAQLGSDRWCSLLAVWQLNGRDALVVTAGTAMTIDALTVERQINAATFIGGSIQPGLQLMWRSMQQGAAQLDHGYPTEDVSADGFACSSQQAMWVGSVQALVAPIASQYAKLVKKVHGELPLLVLSGGDAGLLQRYLPETLSAQTNIVDNLVLKGLACLAERT